MKARLLVVLAAACTSVEGLSGGSVPDAGVDAAPPDAAVPDAGEDGGAPLPPGTIRCPATNVTCDTTNGACCVTVSGMQDPAPRSFTKASATCASSCDASFLGSFDTFTMTFPARCTQPSDCPPTQVCCVSANAMNATDIQAFACTTAAACDAPDGGQTLCDTDPICGATRKCTAQTDPVLSHLYAKFCF